jgi:hypothetical protein
MTQSACFHKAGIHQLGCPVAKRSESNSQSLFASFSSEKKDSLLPQCRFVQYRTCDVPPQVDRLQAVTV